MSNGNGFQQGKVDKSLDRPAAPQGNKTYSEHQNYLRGYGKKN